MGLLEFGLCAEDVVLLVDALDEFAVKVLDAHHDDLGLGVNVVVVFLGNGFSQEILALGEDVLFFLEKTQSFFLRDLYLFEFA